VYRITSLVYWLGKLVGLIGWLLSTTRGRIATVIGAVVLAIIGGGTEAPRSPSGRGVFL
jgi:hypothetical protein